MTIVILYSFNANSNKISYQNANYKTELANKNYYDNYQYNDNYYQPLENDQNYNPNYRYAPSPNIPPPNIPYSDNDANYYIDPNYRQPQNPQDIKPKGYYQDNDSYYIPDSRINNQVNPNNYMHYQDNDNYFFPIPSEPLYPQDNNKLNDNNIPYQDNDSNFVSIPEDNYYHNYTYSVPPGYNDEQYQPLFIPQDERGNYINRETKEEIYIHPLEFN